MAEKTMHQPSTVRLPDASLLITLAYADALDLLFKPDWTVEVVDMVLFEVTRHHTPTSDKLASWLESHQLTIRPTDIHQRYLQALSSSTPPSKAGLGELAIQEALPCKQHQVSAYFYLKITKLREPVLSYPPTAAKSVPERICYF